MRQTVHFNQEIFLVGDPNAAQRRCQKTAVKSQPLTELEKDGANVSPTGAAVVWITRRDITTGIYGLLQNGHVAYHNGYQNSRT